MHEFSMTTQIVESILREAEKHQAKKVTDVHLIIGKLSFLGVEQVRFSYNVLVEDTIMKGSQLYIEEKNGAIKCLSCAYKGALEYQDTLIYHVQIPTLRCPECGNAVEIVEGKECVIKRIRMIK